MTKQTLDKSKVLAELHDFLNNWHELKLDEQNIIKIRASEAKSLQKKINTTTEGVFTEQYFIPSYEQQTEIRLKLYIPSENKSIDKPVILYGHGGGYLFGNVENRDQRHKYLAKKFGVVIVGVEYRLAPENSYPKPQEDCYHALLWMLENAELLGISPNKIITWGDSAGGGIMAGLSLMARDRKEFSIKHQFLIYPMIDDRTCAKQFKNPYIGKYIWNNQHNNFAWQAMLGMPPNSDNVPEYAAPARAKDLTGLPSTFISVGSIDLFYDENIEFAKKLIEQGITTELHVYPNCCHGFDMAINSKMVNQSYNDFEASLTRVLLDIN